MVFLCLCYVIVFFQPDESTQGYYSYYTDAEDHVSPAQPWYITIVITTALTSLPWLNLEQDSINNITLDLPPTVVVWVVCCFIIHCIVRQDTGDWWDAVIKQALVADNMHSKISTRASRSTSLKVVVVVLLLFCCCLQKLANFHYQMAHVQFVIQTFK